MVRNLVSFVLRSKGTTLVTTTRGIPGEGISLHNDEFKKISIIMN
jgi:hypothetical protein